MQTTKIFNFKKPEYGDQARPDPFNENFEKVEEAIADITYFMDKYSYTWTMQEAEDTGDLTIVVTLGEDCPVAASMTAVITEAENGDTTIDVTTVIDGVTSKSSHTINDAGGEGGVVNG